MEFPVGEKEQLILAGVQFARNVDWPTEIESKRAVAIAGARQARVVVGECIGVQPLVAVELIADSVEVFGAALGHNSNIGTGRSSEFGLLAVG